MTSLTSLRPGDLLTGDEAAHYAGVAPSTIRQWKRRGLLAPAIPGDGHRTRNLYAKPDVDKARQSLAQAEAERTAMAAHPTA